MFFFVTRNRTRWTFHLVSVFWSFLRLWFFRSIDRIRAVLTRDLARCAVRTQSSRTDHQSNGERAPRVSLLRMPAVYAATVVCSISDWFSCPQALRSANRSTQSKSPPKCVSVCLCVCMCVCALCDRTVRVGIVYDYKSFFHRWITGRVPAGDVSHFRRRVSSWKSIDACVAALECAPQPSFMYTWSVFVCVTILVTCMRIGKLRSTRPQLCSHSSNGSRRQEHFGARFSE